MLIFLRFLTLSLLLLSCGGQNSPKRIREPFNAGTFYPADSTVLRGQLQSYFEKVSAQEPKGEILGIIAPHAGYAYSGQTAAYAFKLIEGREYETVIVIGPQHPAKPGCPQVRLDGISVYKEGVYRTPFGSVEIDTNFAKTLIAQDERIKFVPDVHVGEHSIEVEIPFLQFTLKKFKLVPIIMGDHSMQMCRTLAHAIVNTAKGKNILIVASSDFYHGYSYADCKKVTADASNLISSYDIEGFYDIFLRKHAACGGAPITTCMIACKELGADSVSLLHITNSGDVTGKKTGWLVGYASFVITGLEKGSLNRKEQETLLNIARTSIEKAVKGERIYLKPVKDRRLLTKQGCFVTITKRGKLRGCIGYIEPVKPLYQAVSEMAIAAATRDRRFPPVVEEELHELSIEISVLSPLKLIKDTSEIVVGRDGLYIMKQGQSGLLLPQVATDRGWDKVTFLEQTCEKAWLPRDAWKREAKIFRFEAQVFGEQD